MIPNNPAAAEPSRTQASASSGVIDTSVSVLDAAVGVGELVVEAVQLGATVVSWTADAAVAVGAAVVEGIGAAASGL